MNREHVDAIARTVLYEGYNLYPYRPSSVKNQRRFNFGVLAPHEYALAQRGTESSSMRTECLVRGSTRTSIDVAIRYLHLQAREVAAVAGGPVDAGGTMAPVLHAVESIEVEGQRYVAWQEAVDRVVTTQTRSIGSILDEPLRFDFGFPNSSATEWLHTADGRAAGAIVRTQWSVAGTAEVAIERIAADVFRISVVVDNTTPFELAEERDRGDALMHSFVSAHTVLSATAGEFVSLLEPPDDLRDAVAGCNNVGVWPVLVGENGARDVMLSSPIILYDYPVIAPESAGDLFDGTEIDEILTLRIMTLTDEEKAEMRGVDDRTRQILDRTENMPVEQLMTLHGVLRGLRPTERDAE